MFQILSLGSMILSLKTMRNIIIIIFILKLLLTYRLNVSNNIECNEIDSNNKSNNYYYPFDVDHSRQICLRTLHFFTTKQKNFFSNKNYYFFISLNSLSFNIYYLKKF